MTQRRILLVVSGGRIQHDPARHSARCPLPGESVSVGAAFRDESGPLHSTLLNVMAHTHGFSSQAPVPLIWFQSSAYGCFGLTRRVGPDHRSAEQDRPLFHSRLVAQTAAGSARTIGGLP